MPIPVLPAAMAVKAMASITSAAAAANQTSSYANLAAQNVDLAIDQFNNAMANWESYIYGTPVSSIPAAARRSAVGQAPLAIIPDQMGMGGVLGGIAAGGGALVGGGPLPLLITGATTATSSGSAADPREGEDDDEEADAFGPYHSGYSGLSSSSGVVNVNDEVGGLPVQPLHAVGRERFDRTGESGRLLIQDQEAWASFARSGSFL
mmetsp:Transcript_3149/g.7358  ORF Transcript_3149/g.7358 Transcript_3149/m.7358 type:complete len:207 (+) Transcript_3149:67-687(+)